MICIDTEITNKENVDYISPIISPSSVEIQFVSNEYEHENYENKSKIENDILSIITNIINTIIVEEEEEKEEKEKNKDLPVKNLEIIPPIIPQPQPHNNPIELEREARITFNEEAHIYRVDGKPMSISVTKFIHNFFSEFESFKICRFMIRGRYFMQKPEHDKYKNLPIWYNNETGEMLSEWNDCPTTSLLQNEIQVIKTITDSWKQNGKLAAELGTRMHANIEHFLLGNTVEDNSPEFGYFLQYNDKMTNAGYIPYRMEMRVFDESISLAGSVDMLWIHKDNVGKPPPVKVSLRDWKRSKQITYKNSTKGKGVCSDVPDCNFYHYSLQLNLYKYIMEKYYNISVIDMGLVILYPENPSYVEIPINDLQFKIREMVCAGSQH